MKAVAEAPSKAIITGEHFVVHGAWALAAALPRKVRVEASEGARFGVMSEALPSGDPSAVRPILKVVRAMAREFSFKPELQLSIRSEIPGGAGLGSSASTMVAVAAAVSRLKSLGLGTDEIVEFSMAGERAIHGHPSGVDPNICARGGVILFRPGSKPRRVRVNGARTLLIAYSGSRRSTRHQINRVSLLSRRYPALFAGLTESAGDLSLLAAEKLARGDLEGLGNLLSFNHAVLSTLGVSTPALDRLVDLLLSMGCYGAKLTGGGGGGSVLAVAPRGKEKSAISGLTARGFESFAAEIPVGGVKSWLER